MDILVNNAPGEISAEEKLKLYNQASFVPETVSPIESNLPRSHVSPVSPPKDFHCPAKVINDKGAYTIDNHETSEVVTIDESDSDIEFVDATDAHRVDHGAVINPKADIFEGVDLNLERNCYPDELPTPIRQLCRAKNVDEHAAMGVLDKMVTGPTGETPKRRTEAEKRNLRKGWRALLNDPVKRKLFIERITDEEVNGHDIRHSLDGPISDLINDALESGDERNVERVSNYIGDIYEQVGALLQNVIKNLTRKGCTAPLLTNGFEFTPNWGTAHMILCPKTGDTQLEIIHEAHLLRIVTNSSLEHIKLLAFVQRLRAHRFLINKWITEDVFSERANLIQRLTIETQRRLRNANLVDEAEKRMYLDKIIYLTNMANAIFDKSFEDRFVTKDGLPSKK